MVCVKNTLVSVIKVSVSHPNLAFNNLELGLRFMEANSLIQGSIFHFPAKRSHCMIILIG